MEKRRKLQSLKLQSRKKNQKKKKRSKLRVLINYLYQYYPFTTASYLEMALKKDNRFEVFRIGENRVPCADFIINVEPCETVISYPTSISCYWEIDNHIHRGQDHIRYQKVDKVFVTQKYFLPFYPKGKTSWLPNAADPEKHRLYVDEPVKYDVGFLGNDTYPRRQKLLELIAEKYKLLRSNSKPGEEYSRKLSRCKILFNCSMDHDVNMRVFEALSIGRLLLTDKVAGQDRLLVDGLHYVSFKDWTDLDQKIAYYLSNKKARETIANKGRAFVHAEHTYQHRLEKILQVCGIY